MGSAHGRLFAALEMNSDWTNWEMHPAGDEVLVMLQGSATFRFEERTGTRDVEFVRVNRWYPVIVYSRPGLYRELGAFNARRRASSRVRLAGDYFSCSNLNTATAAGERAARELLAQER